MALTTTSNFSGKAAGFYISAALKEAKSLGLTYVHLHSSEDGINTYRKVGFVEPDQIELGLILE